MLCRILMWKEENYFGSLTEYLWILVDRRLNECELNLHLRGL